MTEVGTNRTVAVHGRRRHFAELAGAAAFSLAIAIVLTWPEALHPTQVADHFDPYFSIWRLGHLAHALQRWPVNLFDGNIFYPTTNTLAYSDAILLQGLICLLYTSDAADE